MKLHALVIEAAQRTPDALAVSAQDADLTYAELDRLADRFAVAMSGRGVRPGDRVILWGGKSALAVAFMQGALRIGAAYAPVASANPPDRVARIASDSDAVLVVADGATAYTLSSVPAPGELGGAAVVTLDTMLAEAPEDAAPEIFDNRPDDMAYILYTSGSTGTPKGVCLSHRNALAFVDWAVQSLGLGPEDRLSNHAPFNFDLSVFDLYGAFRAGASVHLIPPEMAYAPAQLVAFVRERRISVWYSVPSALTLMMREGELLKGPRPAELRACVFAGEPFAITQAQAMRRSWPDVRLLNWYGPTETNVCTSYEVTEADLQRTGPLPIGSPASGDSIALDPSGKEGEIVVTGPTVMLGYWGRARQAGPYRTGDIGRIGPDGELEYVGRIDHMVKVRGHRVELGEIEAVLARHPSVAAAVVVVTGDALECRLHAVVVPAGAERPRLLGLKQHCARHLPTYMLFDALHVVGSLPLTPNGKTNRPALVAAIEGGPCERHDRHDNRIRARGHRVRGVPQHHGLVRERHQRGDNPRRRQSAVRYDLLRRVQRLRGPAPAPRLCTDTQQHPRHGP
ncbi:amino acid adenylation domain-containing protein [Streptomyces atratus]|uniref:amino acid adenylation domain-containing protein n=1 Tax=Streptomyces atratus TaxID=1893 RepID=UPI0033EBDC33